VKQTTTGHASNFINYNQSDRIGVGGATAELAGVNHTSCKHVTVAPFFDGFVPPPLAVLFHFQADSQ
jgi:hypothetical protein